MNRHEHTAPEPHNMFFFPQQFVEEQSTRSNRDKKSKLKETCHVRYNLGTILLYPGENTLEHRGKRKYPRNTQCPGGSWKTTDSIGVPPKMISLYNVYIYI